MNLIQIWDDAQNYSFDNAISITREYVRENVPYPAKPDKVKDVVIKASDSLASIIAAKEKYDYDSKEYIVLLQNYELAVKQYSLAMTEFDNLFWEKLADEYGVTDNPRLGRLQSIAYDKGHHAGYSEIHSHYQDLVELIR